MDKESALKRWFLPKLFGFSTIKEFFDALEASGDMGTLIDTPIKEYYLQIRFTGRERGIPLHHPDFDNKDLSLRDWK